MIFYLIFFNANGMKNRTAKIIIMVFRLVISIQV